jgi:hypothetical protein
MTHARFSLVMALLAVISLSLAPAQAQPAKVFVAAQGSDSNPCTLAQPCLSFQDAHDTVKAAASSTCSTPPTSACSRRGVN